MIDAMRMGMMVSTATSSSMKTGVAIEAHLYSFIWAPNVFNICFVLSYYIFIKFLTKKLAFN